MPAMIGLMRIRAARLLGRNAYGLVLAGAMAVVISPIVSAAGRSGQQLPNVRQRGGGPPPAMGILTTPAWTNIPLGPTCVNDVINIAAAADPTSPLNVAATWEDFQSGCAGLDGFTAMYGSTDGGQTWAQRALSGPGGTWPARFNGIAYDGTGTAVALAGSFASCGATPWPCTVPSWRSTDRGQTWAPGVYAAQGASITAPSLTRDAVPGSPYAGRSYCTWEYCPPSGEILRGAYSTDSGATWSAGQDLRANTVWMAGAVGPGGVLYFAGVTLPAPGSIVFARSTDGGQTFTWSNVTALTETAQQYSWGNFIRPGIDVERQGPNPGRVFVAWVDNLPSQTHSHVFVTYSDNGGSTWSAPAQVDDDPADTHTHVYATLACSPTNGGVHAFYFDLGCTQSGMSLPYRYAVSSSSDGGMTWHSMMAQDTAVDWAWWNNGPYPGEYEAGFATDSLIYAAWTDARNNPQVSPYLQPIPNPMPWVSSVTPPVVNAGSSGTFTINGGNLVPTITPYAVVFDDPGITASLASVSNTAITLNVSVATVVPGGLHEWSLMYGVPVVGITVAAAAKSGCEGALNVYVGTPTNTVPVTPSRTYTPTPTTTATITPTGTITLTPTVTKTRTPSPTITATTTVTATPTSAGPVIAYPNPASIGTGPIVYFGNVPGNALIDVYNLAGEQVAELQPDPDGIARWYLITPNGYPVVRGLYAWIARYDRFVDRGVIALVR